MTSKKPIPSLIDILVPRSDLKPASPPEVECYKFRYYAGGGEFKGTNDEVIGWNSRRPGWFGFLSKAGNRWYVHRDDLTPESLELALKDLAVKEEAKAKRSEECRQRGQERLNAKAEARRMKIRSSILDGRESEIQNLKGKSIKELARTLGTARATVVRKLQKMEEE